MGRATHNKVTRNMQKPVTNFNIKTSTSVLNSLNSLQDLKQIMEPKTIAHDNYSINSESVANIYKTIAGFSEFTQKIIGWYEENEIVIKNQEQLADDILHEFELGSPKDLYRAYKGYAKLRLSRQLRRKAKSENKMLRPIYTYIKSNPTLPKDMAALCEKCAGIQYDIEHAQYYYKSATE